MSDAAPLTVELFRGGRATSDRCIYPSQGALKNMAATGPLVLCGPGRRARLVGIRRLVDTPQHSTAVWITAKLFDEIVPGADDGVTATVRPATRKERIGMLGSDAWWKVAGAVLAMIATVAAAAVTFVTHKVPFAVALFILVVALIATLIAAVNAVDDATRIKC